MSDNPELPPVVINKPYPVAEKKKSASPLHPVLDLEGWMKEVELHKTVSRIAKELEVRGLMTAEAIRRNPQQIVTVIQQALGIEAARLINHFLKEE